MTIRLLGDENFDHKALAGLLRQVHRGYDPVNTGWK